MIEIKQGDTRHAIQSVLKKADGSAVDLTGTTVRFRMGFRKTLLINADAQITERPGEVWYVFNDGETDIAGLFDAEFTVTYADGKVETFPRVGTIKVRIYERIGGI